MDWLIELERLFTASIEAVCGPRVGVVFSSGVDSTLVAYAASKFSEVTAYHVGVVGAEDTKFARRLAGEAPFKVKYVEMALRDVEEAVPKILAVWPKPNPVDVGVGIPMYMASKAAADDGLNVMLCGQGGDELFGGYWRYLDSLVKKGEGSVVDWMEKDWGSAYADNLDRDIAMNKANGCELRFPYLGGDFSDYVRKMPFDLKIREGGDLVCDEIGGRRFVRKYALKKLASRMGVPEYVVNRVKKAAQYGSGTNKALEKIAREKGYPAKAGDVGRKDYLKMYLEDVLSRQN